MSIVTKVLIGFVAAIHCYILWFEMFAWESRGPKIFSSFADHIFASTTAMAANQGLYNGFLAAGLVWSLIITDVTWATNVALFFLGCVAVAGLYGAMSVSTKTLYVQTIPAGLAILLLLIKR